MSATTHSADDVTVENKVESFYEGEPEDEDDPMEKVEYPRYSYDITEVEGMETLIQRIEEAETIRDWSFILSDYISFGNTKLADNVAIFNMNSATDCPNIGTKHCQVPKSDCYAFTSEQVYNQTLPYRRRQEFLWDCLDPDTFAKAFVKIVERKRNPCDTVRFSQAGDFRHRGDVIKVDRIAEILNKYGIDTYTYSASDYVDWDEAENFFVNASNSGVFDGQQPLDELEGGEYGDQRYIAVLDEDDIPDEGILCPYDATDGEKECGDCRLCITGAPGDRNVYIKLH